MAKKKQYSRKSDQQKSKSAVIDNSCYDGAGLILIDPSRCRFQHSKIRPQFSGCGRNVTQVLEDIKSGKTKVTDLPPIQVLVGSGSSDGWYFSLNNRRLWVLKQLRDGGFLEEQGNLVKVRVRQPKSQSEQERYNISNCALNARIIVEKKKKILSNKTPSSIVTKLEDENGNSYDLKLPSNDCSSNIDNNEGNHEKKKSVAVENTTNSTSISTESDDESHELIVTNNFFGSMIIGSSSSEEEDDDS